MDKLDHGNTDIFIKLLPRSSTNQILGKEGDIYRVKVTSPPVNGKANIALVTLLAKKLGRPKRSIEIITGKSSRIKQVRVRGLSKKAVMKLMEGNKF